MKRDTYEETRFAPVWVKLHRYQGACRVYGIRRIKNPNNGRVLTVAMANWENLQQPRMPGAPVTDWLTLMRLADYLVPIMAPHFPRNPDKEYGRGKCRAERLDGEIIPYKENEP